MKFWLPEARKLKYDESGWARDGYLTLTPGDVFDTEIAEDYIREMGQLYNIKSVSYDQWGATQYAMHLVEDGFDMVKFAQTARFFSAPLDMIEDLVISGKLNHLHDPVLKWMVQNAVIELDSAEHKKLSKKKSSNKIDGLVALAMAVGVFISDEGEAESVYTADRGILSI
jgi:phage terminase large subunit-like protein